MVSPGQTNITDQEQDFQPLQQKTGSQALLSLASPRGDAVASCVFSQL
jgi:hypothetical protein